MRRISKRNPKMAYAMAEKGESVSTLAEKTCLHRATISKILHMKRSATKATSKLIADALETTPEAIGLTIQGGVQ